MAILVIMACFSAFPRHTDAATPAEVDAAIKKAMAYLLAERNASGNWEEVQQPLPNGGSADVTGKQWGGLTSMVTYALLAAGQPPQSKELQQPIQFLENAKIRGIYATGLRCQVWLLLDDPKKLQPVMARDWTTLMQGIHQAPVEGKNEVIGFYPYFYDRPPVDEWYDRSVSQYGVLGVWALAEAGVEIPTKYWFLVDGAWRRSQLRDGGWNYQNGRVGSTATMTAAGIATLFITQDFTLGNLADCRGNVVNANIDAGLAWMDRHIREALGGNYYGMYGIERIGVASGRKYFETVDWYQTGADYIVKNQKPDGSWGAGLPDTCFALLFLVRGRAPVVMNKLEYSVMEPNGKAADGPWNERPRDCANFARWMGRNIEQHNLNWQIVNLKVAPEDLHDAPILYISGNKDLVFTNGEIDKLRAFAEQGGVILANADCGSPVFTKSFEKLAAKLFPQYPFRELPANHPIFDEQFPGAKWKPKPRILGMSNGVRELVLFIPEADLSRSYQARNERIKADLYQLGANIFLYAVDKKNLAVKGETYIITEDPFVKTTRSLTLGRLDVGLNWNPEPAGWNRMAALLHNSQKVAVTIKEVKCELDALRGLNIVHLTGTTAIQLNDAQRAALKQYVETGGTLLVDAAGGNAEFAESAETELTAVFGTAPKLLPPSSPVYNLPGLEIENVTYRAFARKAFGLSGLTRPPRVKGIEVKGRLAVFMSREDLSAGIVGEPVDGIAGYDPAGATAIMRNLVLFGAFGFPKPPATQPTTRPSTQPTTRPATQPTTAPGR